MKKSLLFLLIICSCFATKAQLKGAFGQVAVNYIGESNDIGNLEMQFNLRTSVGLDFGKHWSTGMRMQQLWYRGSSYQFQHLWLLGPFVRYGTEFDKPGRFFLEAGFMRGNYCTCSSISGEAFREDGLNYFAWGGGVEVRITSGIYFSGEMYFHHILNYPERTFGYNGYLLGLVFHLSRGNLSS